MNICLYSEGRLPVCFARGFGLQVGPFVILRDPNQNEIEVAVEKRNGKVYLVDGLGCFWRIFTGFWLVLGSLSFLQIDAFFLIFWVVIWVYLNFVMSLFFCSTHASEGPFYCWCFVLITKMMSSGCFVLKYELYLVCWGVRILMSTIQCFLILHIVYALTFFSWEVKTFSSVLANRIKPYPVFLHNHAQPTVKLSMLLVIMWCCNEVSITIYLTCF